MKKLLILILPFLILGTACKKVDALEGSKETFEVGVNAFDAIDLQGVGTLSYTQDSIYSVTIRTSEEVYKVLQVSVSGTTLIVKVKNGWEIQNGDNIEIFVTGPNVHSFTLSGSGAIAANLNNEQISGGEFEISGSGSLYAYNIDNNGSMDVKISGSGDVALVGVTEAAQVLLSGSGSMSNFNLTTDNTNVKLTGSGTIECRANVNLSVQLPGSGNVYYKGSASVSQDITGSGSVIDAN